MRSQYDCSSFAGIEQEHTFENGSNVIKHHQNKLISRCAKNVGVAEMLPVHTLTMPDVYEASVTDPDREAVDQER